MTFWFRFGVRIAYLSVVTGASGVGNVEQIVVTSRYRGCTDSVREDGTTGNAYFPMFCVPRGDILSGVSKRRCLVSE